MASIGQMLKNKAPDLIIGIGAKIFEAILKTSKTSPPAPPTPPPTPGDQIMIPSAPDLMMTTELVPLLHPPPPPTSPTMATTLLDELSNRSVRRHPHFVVLEMDRVQAEEDLHGTLRKMMQNAAIVTAIREMLPPQPQPPQQ